MELSDELLELNRTDYRRVIGGSGRGPGRSNLLLEHWTRLGRSGSGGAGGGAGRVRVGTGSLKLD